MTALTLEAARRLEQALLASSRINEQLAAVTKASLKQRYTLDELQVRYGGIGRVELKDLLKSCCVWPADTGPGRTTYIPLDHVLLVDAVVNQRLNPLTVTARVA